MFLRIEKGSAVPISRQIADQIAALCASGKLKPEEKLPSVRGLAKELAVNQNTILRVYERLSAAGLLEVRQGQGTFVAAGARAPQLAIHRERLIEELRQIGNLATGLGLSREQLHELLDVALLDEALGQPSSVEANKENPS